MTNRVANLWTEFAARDEYAMGTNGMKCKNPNRFLVAATSEKAKLKFSPRLSFGR